VKPDGAETFWERFLATYRFRRKVGRVVGLVLGRNPSSLGRWT
jgi:hypothetical protein